MRRRVPGACAQGDSLSAVCAGQAARLNSQPKHLAPQLQIVAQRRRRPRVNDPSSLERDGTIGQRERQIEVMIDDDERDFVPQPIEALEELLDDRSAPGPRKARRARGYGRRPKARGRRPPSAARRRRDSRPPCRGGLVGGESIRGCAPPPIGRPSPVWRFRRPSSKFCADRHACETVPVLAARSRRPAERLAPT